MRFRIRIALVVLLVLQAFAAVRVTRSEREFIAGIRAYRLLDYQAALDRFEASRRHWAAASPLWAWSGDAATTLYDELPAPEAAARGRSLLHRAWAGYAGAVLRCPADSWSWSGLAEVATRQARLDDLDRGVDLADLARRSRGVRDPRRAAAERAARVAVRLKPAGFQELDALALFYESTGEVYRARGYFAKSAIMMPAPSFHVWGQGGRLVEPLYRAILDGLEKGIAVAPRFERNLLHREASRFALAHDDLATAIAHVTRALATFDGSYEQYQSLSDAATVWDRAGRWEDAIRSLRAAREIGFAPASDSIRLGQLEFRLGRFNLACRDLRGGLREVPENVPLRIQTAEACERAGEITVSEQLLQDGFVLPTDAPEVARALVDLYRRTRRIKTARALLDTWAKDYPDQAQFRAWAAEWPQ